MSASPFRRTLLASCAAISLSLLAASANADDQAADSSAQTGTIDVLGERTLNLDRRSTAGSRLNLTPLETPASVEIISGETIRDRGDTTLVEAVSRAVGITQFATPGDGNNALSARGFTGVGSVMQLYDGNQLFVGAGTVTFPFDPWTVDHVEVLSGPASVLYGTGAVGGAVNVVPRKPNPTDYENTIELGAGSFKTFHEALDSAGPISSVLSYRLDVSHYNSDGWVDRGQSSSTAVSASLRWDVTDTLNFVLSNDYGDQKPMGYFGTPLIDGVVVGSLLTKNFNALDATMHWVDNWTQLKTEWNIADNVTFHNDFYYLLSNRHWRESEEYDWDASARQIDISSYIQIYHKETQVGDRGDVTVTGTLFDRKNDFVAGFNFNVVDFQHSNDSPYGGGISVDPFNLNPGNFIDLAGTFPRYKTHTEQYSGFAEDRLSLTDQISLVAGVRFDDYDYSRTNLVAPAVNSKTLFSPSWHVGVVYNPTPDLALYAQYATATDPVGSLITLSTASLNFDLSTGQQGEVGIKGSMWDKRIEWTAAAYYIVKDNLLTPTPHNPNLTQQVGEQSSKGLEASLALNLGDGWRIEGNATALQAQFDDFYEDDGTGTLTSRNGKTPPNVPEQAANLWVTWDLDEQWEFRGGVRYVGRQYADNANSVVLASYDVVDAGVRWTPMPKLSLDLRLQNALNDTYVSAPYGSQQWIFGQPRAVQFSMDYRF